jgi:hypothetical protein
VCVGVDFALLRASRFAQGCMAYGAAHDPHGAAPGRMVDVDVDGGWWGRTRTAHRAAWAWAWGMGPHGAWGFLASPKNNPGHA